MKISRIKEFKNFCLAAAILVAGASLASCSSSDDSIIENQQPTNGKYTMTINASKGDGATTRALAPGENHTLNATWAAGEQVNVYEGNTFLGTLTPDLSTIGGTDCTLTGNLTQTPSGSEVTLKFNTPSYTTQNGTLDYIASNCDYATATTTVTVNGNTITGTDAVFANQQAIVKFTLKDINNGILGASELVVNDGTTDYTITPSSATNEIFVAIPGFSEQTITLTATVTPTVGVNKTYIYSKSGVTFTNGQYYEITVKMYERDVMLSSLVADFTARDGQVLSGMLNDNYKISIAADATVTLADVTIKGVDSPSCAWAGLTCEGNATIILADGSTNKVKGFYEYYPGIQAGPNGTTLTIDGTGSLDTSNTNENGVGCSGIGANRGGSCGNIIIQGSVTVTTTGGNDSAGIGANTSGSCGNIIIQGSVKVTATGGASSAGIGANTSGSYGNITITGGTIVANGGDNAAGIGSGYGYNGTCGNIVIEGGDITAYGGGNAAGIGSGGGGTCGNITITGGTITAEGNTYSAGIGSGYYGSCGKITILSTVSKVTATKSEGAPNCIGSGYSGTCGTVTIGGTEYWGENPDAQGQYIYKNGGDTYLTQSTLVYPPAQ